MGTWTCSSPPESPRAPTWTFTVSTTATTQLGTVTATIANGPGNVGDWVGLYATGGSGLLDWLDLTGAKTLPATGLTAATVAFTMPTTPGSYVLRFSTSTTLLATSPPVTVAGATLSVSTTTAAPLSTVSVTAANGPGHPGDWVGLYATGGTEYIDWIYLDGTKTRPTTGLTIATVGFTMPTTPGSYVVRFSSSQTLLAKSPTISVTVPPQ
jgi:hypothetical protein